MRLTSAHHPAIKFVRSLERAAVRRESDRYIAEGVRLVREALATGQRAALVLYDPVALSRTDEGSALLRDLPSWPDELHEVAPHVLKAAAGTETPSGVLAVLRFPEWPPLAQHSRARFGIILDALSDPGNAGTIARTSLAVGAEYLVATAGTVDLFSPKVVRAGMGAHFRLPMYAHQSWQSLVAALPSTSFVAATAGAKESIPDFEWPPQCALVIGSEAHGLSADSLSVVTSTVRIPMKPGVESLNASVAAGILMYAAVQSQLFRSPERYK